MFRASGGDTDAVESVYSPVQSVQQPGWQRASVSGYCYAFRIRRSCVQAQGDFAIETSSTRHGTDMCIVVVVSTDPSDLFFANRMARRFPLAGIVLEHQREPADPRSRWKKAVSLLHRPGALFQRLREMVGIRWHRLLSRYSAPEQPADFGVDGWRLDPEIAVPVLTVHGKGRLNGCECVEWIRARGPDLIVVCGASILREAVLAIPARGVLNLHGGLSQHYRGLFTTDWAIYNNEPEKVGATVHFVSPGIDDGQVIYQGRPRLEADDHPNRAYEKVVKLGIEMMDAAIRAIDAGTLHIPRQPAKGTLYLDRHFTRGVKRGLWRRWRRIMQAYVANRDDRDAAVDTGLLNPFDIVRENRSTQRGDQTDGPSRRGRPIR